MKEKLDPIISLESAPAMTDVHRGNPTEIFPLCKECLQEFQKLSEALEEVTFDEAMERGYVVDTALATLEEAQSRFKAWALNIAALQRKNLRSSLDFRLKDATEIRTRIWKILKDLVQSISIAFLIVTGVRTNETWKTGALSDSEDEIIETPSEDMAETSDLQELFTAIKAANTSLMKMSMIIRNSPGRDDYLKAATRYPFDARWDIGHVKQKHGSENQNNDWLLQRLGKAITRRRQYLKYREDHHGKLSRDWVDELPKEVEADSEPAKTIALTEATKYVENDASNRSPGSEGGGSFGSQTSYEATIVEESTETRLTVPPTPKMAFKEQGIPFNFGEAFQCPYCYTEQTVRNKAAWKKHVYRDLKPYVCTFRECNLRMFSSRNEWFAHELQTHRREWTCSRCRAAPFSTKMSLQTHLKEMHNILLKGSELEAVILQSEEPIGRVSLDACNLCDDWQSSLLNTNRDPRGNFLNEGKDLQPYGTLKQFRRHLGRHMEQLALFALPMHGNEEVEDESSSDDKSGTDLAMDDSESKRVDLTNYGASRNFLLPTVDQCYALTDEQCRMIMDYRDPNGIRMKRNWELEHQAELVRQYMTMRSFPQIEQFMRAKLDWSYRTYANRYRDWLFPIDRVERELAVIDLYAMVTRAKRQGPLDVMSSAPEHAVIILDQGGDEPYMAEETLGHNSGNTNRKHTDPRLASTLNSVDDLDSGDNSESDNDSRISSTSYSFPSKSREGPYEGIISAKVDNGVKDPKEQTDKGKRAKEKSPESESTSVGVKQKPIKFKDAVGRKFSFPFHLCQTWAGMEELIKQAFTHVEVIGPHVMEGHYDLIGPNGEIILPQVWEAVIEPDWAITMHMWPLTEPPGDDPTLVEKSKRKKRFTKPLRVGDLGWIIGKSAKSPRKS